ncbi:hypothetical protein EDM00_02225 [Ornithobacterium rhinotracheale]|uniref:hypothetical protein n=1 Tax=Ornithobacterium rhinotracheale TaxID=28251 RepID=UPI00129C517D|nr:hypothetical protein [Ornithobacterium rhinotracheale]MRI62819.1 hypothetical protein [Ornithobacterium rhinotracheale]MRJ08238.1 hypothetical protein [Ornithobacterium rhinotracheale]UOH77434.1 hypothetical protein MT996_09465 [Ornithobacterium rhinotracheale]
MNHIIKTFLFFGLIFSLYNCTPNYIALQDAEQGLFLDRSKKVSVQTFFNRRMDSELKSRISKNWYIVNEDLDNVYFGQLQKNNEVSFVNPFYRVSKTSLDSIFPGYRSIEGKHIKAKMFQNFVKPIIDERLNTLCPQSQQIDYKKRDYKLTKNGIESEIKFVGKCYEKRIFTAEVKATLSPKNLETITEDIKIK